MSEPRPLLRRFAAPLCALALLLGVALLPRVEIKPRMKVAVSVWPGSEAVVLGRDSGALPQDRIRVVELPWASAVARTFDDGVVDVAVLTLDRVLQLREAGQKLRVILVMDESVGGDAVLARENITSMTALKGKRVGVDVFGVGMYILANALESNGMTLQDIETVPLIQPEIESMLQAGMIDAAVAAEPWLTQVHGGNMRVLHDSRALETPVLRMLVASERACVDFKQELVALARAVTAITAQVRSGSQFEGMTSILRREKLSFGDFTKALEHWRPLSAAENTALLAGPQPKLETLAQEVAEQMRRHGLLQSAPAAGPWIDPQFLTTAWSP